MRRSVCGQAESEQLDAYIHGVSGGSSLDHFPANEGAVARRSSMVVEHIFELMNGGNEHKGEFAAGPIPLFGLTAATTNPRPSPVVALVHPRLYSC